MTNIELKSKEIILNKVRIIFPSLFEKENNKEFPVPEEKRKYAARFLLSKTDPIHAKTIKEIQDTITLFLKAKKIIDDIDAYKFWRDGDKLTQYDEDGKLDYLKGHYRVMGSNIMQPNVTYLDGSVITAENKGLIYPGCYVHASIKLYPHSKGVGSSLEHVQFSKKGDPIGGFAPKRADDKFNTDGDDKLEEDDNADFGKYKQDNDIPEKDIF
jgi:hypothetical protein